MCFNCIFVSLLAIAHKNIFMDEYYLRTDTTASCDQFKPIRIEDNLVFNYNVGYLLHVCFFSTKTRSFNQSTAEYLFMNVRYICI